MILTETSSRKPSRLAFWTVLGLGALLLPLAPRVARTEAPEEPARKESPRHENAKRQPAAAERDRSKEIEKLQDEIELLKLQVQLKETQLRITKKQVAESLRRFDSQQEVNKRTPGAIPFDSLMETHLTVLKFRSEADIEEAELRQSAVRLKQVERRLARLQRPGEKTDGGVRAQQDKRLRELEQKVESLLKEIHKLRREMRPDKPRAPGPIPDGLQR